MKKELVLVGGGHTHVQVLRRFIMEPPAGLRVTLLVDRPVAIYSGMVPGFVAGQYRAEELEIDVVPLARRAGARVVLSPATRLDTENQRIELADRPALPYDLASFDIGSTVAGLDLPGVSEWALPTRPISKLVTSIPQLLDRARAESGPFRLLVVGGGAGGIEMMFTLRERLRKETNRKVETTVVHAGDRLLPGYGENLIRRVEAQARARDIEILTRTRVDRVHESHIELSDGRQLEHDATIWVAGADSHGLFRRSGVSVEERGFALIRDTLQLLEHDNVFACGDCATLVDYPKTAKAGVYAVRQGPYLIDNLLARAAGRELRRYKPQKDFLTLLNLGDGTALGAKWSRSFGGRWVMRLKDRIDRKFMRLFQVLDRRGAEIEDAGLSMESEMEMTCGGCAAKVGQSSLDRVLERLAGVDPSLDERERYGLAAHDDAAAWKTKHGELVLSSVDFFRAFTDDPWLVGRVAALNACSDLWAKGIAPHHAQALVTVPDDTDAERSEEELFQVMQGIQSALAEHGVALLGGHSTLGQELHVGLSVDGLAGDGPVLPIDGARAGQSVVSTRPLGTGVLLHADMAGRCRGPWLASCIESLQRDNETAARLALEAGATAMTDITGFGLAGHLGEMARLSGVDIEVEVDRVPALPGALELLRRGERSTFHEQNARLRRAFRIEGSAHIDPVAVELLFDPQTSGGLLVALDSDAAGTLVERLRAHHHEAATVVGKVQKLEGDVGTLILL